MADVLIAEDIGMQATLIERYLRGVHDVVDIVTTADGAVEAVRENGADVVVMDLNLHEGTGIEATEAIKEIDRGVGVVVSTVAAGADVRERALEAGADVYLVKPYDQEELLEAVESAAP
ncbi:response regulator [Halobellus sp. EA9]|uniref:response regulator n=1 Tax=Halobellus sp. EA9 TaxID=3421647 RepID=UPI003EBE4CF0